MCFIGIKPRGNISNIAEEPIEVYKVLRKNSLGELYAPYICGFSYMLGKIYETTFEFLDISEGYIKIGNGFHSYSKECISTLTTEWVGVSSITRGTRLLGFKIGFSNYIVVKCIIPKGAMYYENKYGEIVSSRLQVVSELEGEWEMAKFKDICAG